MFGHSTQPVPFDKSTTSAVIDAARIGDFPCVRGHLQANALLVNATNPTTKETAFSAALVNGHGRVCELLLRHGARISCVYGLASENGEHRSSARFIPRTRASSTQYPNNSHNGWSALSWAALHCESEMIDLLVDHGARLDAMECSWLPLPPGMGATVWEMGDSPSDLTVFRLLAVACWRRHHALVDHLCTRYSMLRDRQLMGKFGALALCCAVHRENEDMVVELLARGAPADQPDLNACAAAVRVDSVRMLRLLLQHSKDLVLSSDHLQELLVCASECGAVACVEECIRLFSDRPADQHALLQEQALAAAIQNGHIAVVSVLLLLLLLLLSLPSPLSIETWLRDATEQGNAELLELLLSSFPHAATDQVLLQQCLVSACTRGLYDVVWLLLAYGVDVDAPCFQGTTFLLHHVLSQRHQSHAYPKIVMLLLENGANVHASDVYGETPLAVVCRMQRYADTPDAAAQLTAMEELLRDQGAIQ